VREDPARTLAGMDLWLWILLAVAIVVLVIVAISVSKTIRPKPPEPLGTTYVEPSAVGPYSSSPARGPRPAAPDPLTPDVSAEIDRLVAADPKITAIKVLREHSGLSLRDAKDQIDAWVPSAPGTMDAVPVSLAGSDLRPAGAPSYAGGLPTSDAVAGLAPDVRAEIDRLVAADQKIAAIKLLREATGLGLRDSKDAVEAWR
jgi:ribosomal protein L7/L12